MASDKRVENDFEKQLKRAKWLKEDLDKGDGWTQRYNVPNEYNSWSKTFCEEEVPVKTLYLFENLPMSIEKFAEMMHPSKIEIRTKWDRAFAGLETLETLPNEASIVYTRIELSFPLTDRSLVLHVEPPTKTDWFGKKAYAMFVTNAAHDKKPERADGLIRGVNGGNFYIALQDDKEPETKCKVFGLTNNNYNGWVPDSIECLIARKASKVFYEFRQSLIEGHKKYFS